MDESCLSWKVPHRTLPSCDRGNYLFSRESCHSECLKTYRSERKGFFTITNKLWNEVETCCKNLLNFCVITGLSSCFKRQFRGWGTVTSLPWNVRRKAVVSILIMQVKVWSLYSVVKTVLKHRSSLLSDFYPKTVILPTH